MNTQERRQLIRAQVIDAAIAKVAINKSRRERANAAKNLRKALAQSQYANRRADSTFHIQTG